MYFFCLRWDVVHGAVVPGAVDCRVRVIYNERKRNGFFRSARDCYCRHCVMSVACVVLRHHFTLFERFYAYFHEHSVAWLLITFLRSALCLCYLRYCFRMNTESPISQEISDNTHFGKIVATLGPASESEEGIASLVKAGVDVFRLNFSHATGDEQGARIEKIRALEKRIGRPIGILADLQGPKLRIGEVSGGGGVSVQTGDVFMFRLQEVVGNEKEASLPHPEIFKAAKVGMDILVDDGRLQFRVTEVSEDVLKTEIITGGIIKTNYKGVNIPTVQLPVSAMTEKDKVDLQFAVSQGVDWIALSFVQRPGDIQEAKKLIGDEATGIIAKIEKPSALECLEEIVAEVDGIMVARGDLGIEIPPEDVPRAQTRMIALCREVGKPVIVATHMLDSMISSPNPTRAEVSDVANAVYGGADAVMLSAETAIGDHPACVAAMMRRIVRKTVTDPNFFNVVNCFDVDMPHCSHDVAVVDVLCADAEKEKVDAVAIRLFETQDVEKVACYARRRVRFPLFVAGESAQAVRKSLLFWGVSGVILPEADSDVAEEVRKAGLMSEKGVVHVGKE